jgi:citronellol/citronellal dehydrogenase
MFAADLFAQKTVFVSGGGSGIGLAIAKMFLQHGAKVIIASRKADRIEAALAALNPFGEVEGLTLDIREPDQITAVAQGIKAKGGTVDILVNNAGGQFPSAAEEMSPKGWAAVVNNNLNGTFYMSQLFAKEIFIPQKHGCILNIIAQIERGFPGMTHTGAARAGVDNMTKSLAIEWLPYHIRVNAVAPGIIDSSGLDQYPPDLLTKIKASIPARRLGSVDEVAALCLYLAAPLADYITGETVYIDGGQRLWGSMWEVPESF